MSDILKNLSRNDMLQALLISLLAILLVFLILVLIILICSGLFKVINTVDSKLNIQPKEENKILETDKDAVVASIVATIEFNNETNKNAKLVKIERID